MSESAADARFFRRISALERGRQTVEPRGSFIDAMNALAVTTFGYDGNTYALPMATTYGNTKREDPDGSFTSFAELFVKRDPVVFGVMQARALLLSETRFKFRRLSDKRIFGTTALAPLDAPQPNTDTGEWLTSIDQHASIGGNAYVVRRSRELLRPDWVSIVLESSFDPEHPAFAYDAKPVAYIYNPPQGEARTFMADQVVHFSPIPDPVARFRGMSWLQPLIREVLSDQAATVHKQRFFEHAAPQPMDAKILTPEGWSTMGDMRVGAEVIGSDGKPHRVVGVFPQGQREIFRVRFSDGSVVECTSDHVWQVANNYDLKRGTHRVMSLGQIVAEGLRYKSGAHKWSTPMVEPVQFYGDAEPLPVNPYLLGLLLGDGSFCRHANGSGAISLAMHSDDATETMRLVGDLLPEGVEVTVRHRGGLSSEAHFRALGQRGNPLTAAIRALRLFGVTGSDKFVPGPYLRASVTERVALLQGLLDSDGSVSAKQPSSVRFANTSRALCDAVVELVRSLGGTASVGAVRERSTPLYTVNIWRLPEWIVPFRLSRKAGAYRPSLKRRVRWIVGVERVRFAEAQCIAVDVPDHLYVTDDYVLTHNTPNLAIKFPESIKTREQFEQIRDAMESSHAGSSNAWKTLYLAAGADVSVVGADMQALDLKTIQGGYETRICVAARVPAVVAGVSEGMQGSSLNAGNFSQARRLFVDGWFRPYVRALCSTLAPLVSVPSDAELWFDDTDIGFLREDQKDAAEIAQTQATTLRSLIDAGFAPDAAVEFVQSLDPARLTGQHSGLYSVQLQAPMSSDPGAPEDVEPERSTDEDVLTITNAVQKIYLGVVNGVLSAEEARRILNRIGAGLDGPPPAGSTEPQPAQPAA